MPKPCSLNQRFSPNSTFCHALGLCWHPCQGLKPSPLFLPCLPSKDQLVCHWERVCRASGGPSCSPRGAPDIAGVAPISQRIQLKDTQQAGPPHPQLKPLQHSSWQPGACAALGDPLASCLPLASVHQPSEGLKHLQEPARLASRSGSVPSPLPPLDLPHQTLSLHPPRCSPLSSPFQPFKAPPYLALRLSAEMLALYLLL